MSSNSVLVNCANLFQCEEKLRTCIRPGELLGRIPLTAEEYLHLSSLIKNSIGRRGTNESMRLAWEAFPTIMAVFLIQTGIRHYRGGELWPAVANHAGFPAINSSEWGYNFLVFLRRNSLPAFEDIGGLRYITPILAHGGIPNYCLNDYFEFVLTPAMEMGGATVEGILDDLLRGSGVRYLVDKPIQRFLLKGGDYAVDFFDRTLEMARRTVNEQGVPDGDELGLPDRITRSYGQWVQQKPERRVNRDSLQSPVIALDPYGLGVTAILSSQQLRTVNVGVSWDIRAGDKSSRVFCRAWRVGNRIKSEVKQTPLPPAEIYVITLIVDGQEYRSWNFRAMQVDRPYLAFIMSSGRLVRGDVLPCEGVWLLLKQGWSIGIDGGATADELPPLAVAWRHYHGIELYHVTAAQITLRGPGGSTFTVPFAGPSRRPTLVGGNRITTDTPGELTYLGKLPALRIPNIGSEGNTPLDLWHLYIRWETEDDPVLTVSINISDYAHHIDRDDQGWLLPLDTPGILGPKALGAYQLSVRGPLGSDARFHLTCVYGMDISLPEEGLWPGWTGEYPPARARITAPASIAVDFKNCTLEKTKQQDEFIHYRCVVGGYSIICELHSAELARPITIRQVIRPISWGWVGIGENCLVWENRCRTLNSKEWRESEDLQLVLSTNQNGMVYRVSLTLRNAKAEVLQISTGQLTEERKLRFRFGQFRDTIVSTSLPEYELWLTVEDGREKRTEFRVALIDREWRPTNVQLLPDSLNDGASRCLVLWDENDKITNRIVRVWTVWRPWDDPIVFSVPDIGNSIVVNFDKPLGPGIYRFEIAYLREDLFLSQTDRSLIPPARSPSVCDLRVKPANWYPYARALPKTVPGGLERFLIDRGLNETDDIGSPTEGDQGRYQFRDFKSIFLTGIMLNAESDETILKSYAWYLKAHSRPSSYELGIEAIGSLLNEGVAIPPEVLASTGWCLLNYGDLDKADTNGQLDELWRIWPLAGLLMEQVAYVKSKGTLGSLIHVLSLQGLERLLGRPDEASYQWPKGPICPYSLTECTFRLLRYECICEDVLPEIPREITGDSQNIKMVCLRSADELEGMRSLLNIAPRGLLDADYYAWCLFEWLIEVKRSQKEGYVGSWVEDNIGRANRILRQLSEDAGVNEEIINCLTQRYVDPKGSLSMVNFPYISGVVALAQRCMVREVGNGNDELNVEDLAIDVCRIYPGLYCRDLCVFEILLSVLL